MFSKRHSEAIKTLLVRLWTMCIRIRTVRIVLVSILQDDHRKSNTYGILQMKVL